MSEQIFGDQVEPGDEIGPLLKHPDLAQVQRYLGAWNQPSAAALGRFTDNTAAERDGFAGAIVPGPMSQAFLSQLLTDWAGPLGRIKSLDVNFRRPAQHGEDLRCIGLITDKQTLDEEDNSGSTLVKIDVFIEDLRGDRPTQGVAEVIVPTSP